MLHIDTAVGKIISDEELKQQAAAAQPYQKWLDDNLTLLTDLPSSETPGASETLGVSPSLTKRQQAFGYSFEDLRVILSPMARKGAEPLGSMGNDTPLAVLSERPQLLYNYIKQLFAQVTNPPIDAIREALITGTEILLGAEGNLLSPEPVNCRRIKLDSPILTNHDFRKIQYLFDDSNRHESANQPPDDDRLQAFKAVTLPIIFSIKEGHRGLAESLEVLFESAVQAISNGANLLILSDRGLDQEQAAIPALLATSGLHHHLISRGLRTRVSLIVESGEPREVHHFAALIGYGADAINP
jgi:glutamate synthase (ferredoxin)